MPPILSQKLPVKLTKPTKIGKVDVVFRGLLLAGVVLCVFAIWLIPLDVLIALILVYALSASGIAFWKYYGL